MVSVASLVVFEVTKIDVFAMKGTGVKTVDDTQNMTGSYRWRSMHSSPPTPAGSYVSVWAASGLPTTKIVAETANPANPAYTDGAASGVGAPVWTVDPVGEPNFGGYWTVNMTKLRTYIYT
jgi:hypothetical protein